MRKIIKFSAIAILLAVFLYAASGYVSAYKHHARLQQRAKALIAAGQGAEALGKDRLHLLLRLQDPAFYAHKGVDHKTAGAGLTTVTQSLSKRLAFNNFKPGVRKIRQTTYAIVLEKHLTKDEILALFLETVPMGQGSNGWTIGFFNASQAFYGAPPQELSDRQFTELISVMIAPRLFNHISRGQIFIERLNRIERLFNGECQPKNNADVWLKACAVREGAPSARGLTPAL